MISGMGDARIVNISLRVYSVLLSSYPQSFRQEYAPHMLQAFGDYTRRVYQQRGLAGMLWWWTLTLFDFLNTVMEEHLQRITSMTREKFIHLGGWSLMLSAIVMIASFGIGNMYDSPFGRSAAYEAIEATLWIAFPLLFAVGYGALRSQYQKKLGSLGNISLLAGIGTGLIGFTGLLASLFLRLDDIAWPLIMFSFLSAMIAMMLFGIDALRKRYLPRWGSFPFIAGLVPVLAFVGQITLEERPWGPTPLDPLMEYAPLVFAIGTFLLGYMLQGEGKAAEEAS